MIMETNMNPGSVRSAGDSTALLAEFDIPRSNQTCSRSPQRTAAARGDASEIGPIDSVTREYVHRLAETRDLSTLR